MTCGTSLTPTTAFPTALCTAAWCCWRRARFPRSSLSVAPMLQHRVRTLAVNMIVTMTVPWFFLHPACVVHSTNDPAAHMTISAIALIFNVCVFVYQAYTIFRQEA